MKIKEYVERLLAHLGVVGATVDLVEQENEVLVKIKVSEEESGLLIGVRGETLNALQRSTYLSFRDYLADKHMTVHVNDYLERREERLKEMTRRIAEEVLATGKSYTYEYLNSKERLIIHSFVGQEPGMEDLETVSQGEGGDRRLQLRPKAQ